MKPRMLIYVGRVVKTLILFVNIPFQTYYVCLQLISFHQCSFFCESHYVHHYSLLLKGTIYLPSLSNCCIESYSPCHRTKAKHIMSFFLFAEIVNVSFINNHVLQALLHKKIINIVRQCHLFGINFTGN